MYAVKRGVWAGYPFESAIGPSTQRDNNTKTGNDVETISGDILFYLLTRLCVRFFFSPAISLFGCAKQS